MTALTSTPQPTTATRTRARTRARRRNVVAHLFLGVLVIYFLIPFWWLFVASTEGCRRAVRRHGGALWFAENFDLFAQPAATCSPTTAASTCSGSATRVLYALAGGVGATVLAVLAGYGFAKFRFRGRNFIVRAAARLGDGAAHRAGHPDVHAAVATAA